MAKRLVIIMTEDVAFVGSKLRRWEKYLDNFKLPTWNEIPDIGLFMDQVITLLTQYLDYLPPELKEDNCITPAAINNYVRMKIMPEPRKKRYYRLHIAYLLMICTMKQSLSIALLRKMIPVGIPEEEFAPIYSAYVERHRRTAQYFNQQVAKAADPILHGENATPQDINNLIFVMSIISGFCQLLAEKLILLEPPKEAEEKAGIS